MSPDLSLSDTHSQYTNTNIITIIYTIFFPVMYSNFHYIFSCFYLKRIPYLCPGKSHDFMFWYTVSEYKYIMIVLFLNIIYTIVIYISPYIISVLHIADFIYRKLYIETPFLFITYHYSFRRNSWRFLSILIFYFP